MGSLAPMWCGSGCAERLRKVGKGGKKLRVARWLAEADVPAVRIYEDDLLATTGGGHQFHSGTR
jgi:hypothetical protein